MLLWLALLGPMPRLISIAHLYPLHLNYSPTQPSYLHDTKYPLKFSHTTP